MALTPYLYDISRYPTPSFKILATALPLTNAILILATLISVIRGQNCKFYVTKHGFNLRYLNFPLFLHISVDIFKHGHLRYNRSCGRHAAKAVTLELNKRYKSVIFK